MAYIKGLHNFGTIVSVELDDGRMVNFDHRMVRALLEDYSDEEGTVDFSQQQFETDGETLWLIG